MNSFTMVTEGINQWSMVSFRTSEGVSFGHDLAPPLFRCFFHSQSSLLDPEKLLLVWDEVAPAVSRHGLADLLQQLGDLLPVVLVLVVDDVIPVFASLH